MRRWLREAIRHSLVMGSIADGLRMHDLVRDFTLARAADREGGVAALQRDALRAMLKAGLETGREKGGGGFVDLVVAMDAGERGADLPAYVSLSSATTSPAPSTRPRRSPIRRRARSTSLCTR